LFPTLQNETLRVDLENIGNPEPEVPENLGELSVMKPKIKNFMRA
jgi:hypothetical protein